jgi:hypothetical protein
VKRRVVMSAVGALGISVLAGGQAAAQPAPWQIAQGSDGTLYLIVGGTRFELVPDEISDDDLAALDDGGTIGSQLPAPTPVPSPTPLPPTETPVPTVPPEAPINFTGSGEQNTKALTLRGGTYTVGWSVNWPGTAPGGQRSFAALALKNVDLSQATPVNLVDKELDPGTTLSGETQAYSLPAGQYYVAAIGEASWKVTVTPQ